MWFLGVLRGPDSCVYSRRAVAESQLTVAERGTNWNCLGPVRLDRQRVPRQLRLLRKTPRSLCLDRATREDSASPPLLLVVHLLPIKLKTLQAKWIMQAIRKTHLLNSELLIFGQLATWRQRTEVRLFNEFASWTCPFLLWPPTQSVPNAKYFQTFSHVEFCWHIRPRQMSKIMYYDGFFLRQMLGQESFDWQAIATFDWLSHKASCFWNQNAFLLGIISKSKNFLIWKKIFLFFRKAKNQYVNPLSWRHFLILKPESWIIIHMLWFRILLSIRDTDAHSRILLSFGIFLKLLKIFSRRFFENFCQQFFFRIFFPECFEIFLRTHVGWRT